MKVEELERLHEAATGAPWEVDTEYDGDALASSGGGCTSGFNNYAMFAEIDGKWQSLFDSTNADHKLIEDDRDGDGGSAWDTIAAANFALIVALRNALPDIIATYRERDSYKAALEEISSHQQKMARDPYEAAARQPLIDIARTALERRGSE